MGRQSPPIDSHCSDRPNGFLKFKLLTNDDGSGRMGEGEGALAVGPASFRVPSHVRVPERTSGMHTNRDLSKLNSVRRGNMGGS
ncbi:hypothetical protein GWI33_007449 [Rhynchophorus ferrugineus]|uniref:Uncharacterized protein n=1 Tax=Rhynchophorus ferrugineus TaxID=354439 RepID=A0A834IT63_RHYFE|nr:hypothetical protein GWI33_007449 [Rhynchophorus ferrugineus]